MALAKRSRGGMTGWVAAGLLALAVYAAQTGEVADADSERTLEVEAAESIDD